MYEYVNLYYCICSRPFYGIFPGVQAQKCAAFIFLSAHLFYATRLTLQELCTKGMWRRRSCTQAYTYIHISLHAKHIYIFICESKEKRKYVFAILLSAYLPQKYIHKYIYIYKYIHFFLVLSRFLYIALQHYFSLMCIFDAQMN